MTATLDMRQLEQSLSHLLEGQQTLARQLLELLRQEYQLLQGTEPGPLNNLTLEKQRRIEELEQTVGDLHGVLGRLGLSPDRQGLEKFLCQLEPGAPLRERWRDFEQTLGECRQQNEINGGVLTLSRRHLSNALDLLYGVKAEQKSYGRSGQSHTSHRTGSLGRA